MITSPSKLLAYSSLLILPSVSVLIGYVIGCCMGMSGGWLLGLAVLEALIGLVSSVKLILLT
jgi:hypothetical protein